MGLASSQRTYIPHETLGAVLLGATIGLLAATAMWWWQRSVEVGLASLIIVGYTTGTWFRLRADSRWSCELQRHLKTLAINATGRRVVRLLLDRSFWWSLAFGLSVIGGSAWYAGLRAPMLLLDVEIVWAALTVLLNFELTLLEPTVCCRRCGYSLIGQLDTDEPEQVVRCPECGSNWSKLDLCLVPPV